MGEKNADNPATLCPVSQLVAKFPDKPSSSQGPVVGGVADEAPMQAAAGSAVCVCVCVTLHFTWSFHRGQAELLAAWSGLSFGTSRSLDLSTSQVLRQ